MVPPAHVAGFLFVSFVLFCTTSAFGASVLPEPVPGWRIETVLEAPKLKHPSVVACAPDGRVFVAEDPMDISLPKADMAEGRILCVHPDGRVTVFAEKLHAVFGLQYLEGKLYVLHNPRFSVFDDDNGVGRNRRELIEQTLPEPWALNWNDHVPANFRLAMDGYFYVACGDKGLHGAQGTDGSRADLFSGGVFRIRPDGSRLEVYCQGVRNILDVAINAEDEIFTYDNTDEHDWMGRLTHMVDGGFYGYPHDFIPRRPYTLWMMEDYGAGAATGAFAYNEDALPPEYHGNLFLADFGKRQIMRVRVEREGATHRAVSKEDLFPNPPGDFRPVGIAPGPDGTSIYICDWQHRDEKADVNVGRLLKLTWNGKDHSRPKPDWYVPAAMGKRIDANANDLVLSLIQHPAHSVRLAAQRELARRGPGVADALRLPLEDHHLPAPAQMHALWALDVVEAKRAAKSAAFLVQMTGSPYHSAATIRQCLRLLGERRVVEAIPAVEKALQTADAAVRFQAATALGRIGHTNAVAALLRQLNDADEWVRFASFTALNRIGRANSRSWPAIVRGLEDEGSRVREGTVFALRETYEAGLLDALVTVFRDDRKSPRARNAALGLIAALHHQPPAWKGEWWGYHPALQPPPPKTESWDGTGKVLAVLRDGLKESDPALRRACIEGLAAAGDIQSAPALRAAFSRETDTVSRVTILRALGTMKDSASVELANAVLAQRSVRELTSAAIAALEQSGSRAAVASLTAFATQTQSDVESLSEAVAALGRLRAKPAESTLMALARHSHARVRAAAIDALGRVAGERALDTLVSGLKDADLEVRQAAVKALGNLRSPGAVPALLNTYKEEAALRADSIQALVRLPDPRALNAYLDGLGSRNPAERNAAHLAVRDIREKVLKDLEAKASSLTPQVLTELRQIYAGDAVAERGPLFAVPIQQHTPDDYLDFAVQQEGDAERGKKLFADARGMNCVLCHRVAGQGGDIGPDLTGIGAQFDRRALAESLLFPSKAVREGYQQVILELDDGDELSGVIKGETADTITLRDSAGSEHKLSRKAVRARRNSALSLMPEGLQAGLSLQEFADLVAYLASLKGGP